MNRLRSSLKRGKDLFEMNKNINENILHDIPIPNKLLSPKLKKCVINNENSNNNYNSILNISSSPIQMKPCTQSIHFNSSNLENIFNDNSKIINKSNTDNSTKNVLQMSNKDLKNELKRIREYQNKRKLTRKNLLNLKNKTKLYSLDSNHSKLIKKLTNNALNIESNTFNINDSYLSNNSTFL